MSITLSLGGLSLTLNKFTGTDNIRSSFQPPSTLEFSALGTPAIGGIAVEAKQIWSFGAAINQTERDTLEAILWEFQYRRRSLLDYDVLISDRTSRIVERLPRSRAIVPLTAERLIGLTHTAYFSQFKAVFTEIPKFTLPRDACSKNSLVTLTLIETVKTIAMAAPAVPGIA